MNNNSIVLLDCTLRDGGYYNKWNFSKEVINTYLKAMQTAGVDIVELGFRTLKNEDFKGACAYTTDSFIRSLSIPDGLKICVMINASELLLGNLPLESLLERLFPESAHTSLVSLIRIACHAHEFSKVLPASTWLKNRGFTVGFNLMQIADLSQEDIELLSLQASQWPLDVLYFADSMGSMDPAQTEKIISWLRKHWDGSLGIHTHDNMGMALQNTLKAVNEGVSWLDSTLTGMGRGPGNAKTEYLVLEIAQLRKTNYNIIPLMKLIKDVFQPIQIRCGWGTNTYYYLAGKYGIHPTYIQEMLSDSRYNEEDIIAVIEHLRQEGGKKFSLNTLDAARHFYQGPPRGTWNPATLINNREVLLLGTGPGVEAHQYALELFINKTQPIVIALNTQSQISAELINVRVACHPVRLLADCEVHAILPQPLITPASMLPQDVQNSLQNKEMLDFGLEVQENTFSFSTFHATLPTSLVIAYALAIATCGRASQIFLAGFDGYESGDLRNQEMSKLLKLYSEQDSAVPLTAITPTCYDIPSKSVYGLVEN